MSVQRRRSGRSSSTRTWTLGTLNRHQEYLLFFHQGTRSWEVMVIDSRKSALALVDPAPVVTKPEVAQRRAERRNGRARSARGLSHGPAPAEAASNAGNAHTQAQAAS